MRKFRFIHSVVACIGAATLLAGPAQAADPYTYPNNSWISVSGTVNAVGPDWFTLDFTDSLITVEMDDGDRDADAYVLVPGDTVTVHGRIDDDMFETRTIEAGRVYVEKLDTWFFSSSVDEEDFGLLTVGTAVIQPMMVVQGKVTEVDGREFTIDAGPRTIRVDTGEMAYNPMDDEGYQKIEVGDVVSVSGEVDYDFFEGRELMANMIITISNR